MKCTRCVTIIASFQQII